MKAPQVLFMTTRAKRPVRMKIHATTVAELPGI